MRKTLLILAATSVLASGAAFAAQSQAPAQPAAQTTPVKHQAKKAKASKHQAADTKKASN